LGRKAILVCRNLEGAALRAAQLLDFFGIPWQQAAPSALTESNPGGAYCVLAAIPLVAGALTGRVVGDRLPALLEGAESTFLFDGDRSTDTQAVLQLVSRCTTVRLNQIQEKVVLCSVADQCIDVCGPLSGLTVPVPVRGIQLTMTPIPGSANVRPIICTNEGWIFAVADFNGSRCYLAPGTAVIDILGPVEKGYFDIADYFFSAVPLVMYLRHAFKDEVPRPPESGACLIVDDPVLRPRYGFFDVSRISELATEHNFTCNIAFIPWNWKRTRASVVDVFRRNPGRLSLSVHGCDHTGREFGTTNAQALNIRAKLALLRMEKHRQQSGLPFDPVMVFPQGAFSAVSPGVLKHNGFLAAVNTEVSTIEQPVKTEIREVWRIAIRRYGDFAIYTRRYPFHGLHNFAFDLLLGKPCLIASHSADFRDDSRNLVDFIDRLNSLSHTLTWRPLGDVIRSAYLERMGSDAALEIEMFANEISVQNRGATSAHVVIKKLEHDPEAIARVGAAGYEVTLVPGPEYSRFELDVTKGNRALIRVDFNDIYGHVEQKGHLGGQIKQAARRYLSEFRDETQAKAPWLYDLMQKARSWRTTASRVS
jgi:hypothetical protein